MFNKKNNLPNGIQKLNDKDTGSVTGGINTPVYNPRMSKNDIRVTCPSPDCGCAVEFSSKSKKLGTGVHEIVWKCPACGLEAKSFVDFKKNVFWRNSVEGSTFLANDIKNFNH
jgi:hypothetical protein